MQYLDVVNNKLCPYCGTNISALDLGDKSPEYDHCYCKNYCIKVMYDHATQEWILIRVYLDEDIKINIEFDKRRNTTELCKIIINPIATYDEIIIPAFNVFSYSKTELASKIKKYLVFS